MRQPDTRAPHMSQLPSHTAITHHEKGTKPLDSILLNPHLQLSHIVTHSPAGHQVCSQCLGCCLNLYVSITCQHHMSSKQSVDLLAMVLQAVVESHAPEAHMCREAIS